MADHAGRASGVVHVDGIPGGAGDGEVGRLPDRVVVPEARGGDFPGRGGPGQRAPVGVEAQLGRQRARGQLAGGEEGEAAPPTVPADEGGDEVVGRCGEQVLGGPDLGEVAALAEDGDLVAEIPPDAGSTLTSSVTVLRT